MSKTTFVAILVALILGILIFIKESNNDAEYTMLKDDAVILAFGDSLTYGFGASEGYSYPDQLQNKTDLRVINAGINGEVTSEGVLRLPKLLEKKVDLVILCHGGNDILQKLSIIQLKNNLLHMINLSKESGAVVVLVGVPDFSLFGFDTHKVYNEVADETGVIFEDEILSYIELRRIYKSDYIHPNEKGYEIMADSFINILRKYKIL